MTTNEFSMILFILAAVIGGIAGGFAGRNWIYVRLSQSNLAGDEEKIEGEEEADRTSRQYAVAGGIGAFLLGLFFVYIGGLLPGMSVKTLCLLIALVFFAVGAWLIRWGLQK